MGVAHARRASLEEARLRPQRELGDTLSRGGKARCAGPAAAPLRHVPARLEAGPRGASGDAGRLAEEARALSAQLPELRRTCEESAASQRTLRRENRNLKGTLPWEPEQGPRGTLCQGQGCLMRRNLSIITASLGS